MPRSHCSCLSDSWAAGILRTSASSMPTVCSAAETTLPYGAFTTTTPCREHASTSMLSTPTPARPRMRSRAARARNSGVTAVEERVMIASYSPTRPSSSSRGTLLETWSTVKPRSVREAIPSAEIVSMTRTFISVLRPVRAQELEELAALRESAAHHLTVADHLRGQGEHLPGAEVEAAVEVVHRAEDLGAREMRVAEGAHLPARAVHERVGLEPPVALRFLVERGARIRRGQRDLDGVWIDLGGEPDGLGDGLARLTGQAQDERPVDGNAQRPGVAGEPWRHVGAHPVLDVVEDGLVARL